MDWHLAIEKNREALKRVLAMLVAMTGLSDLRTGGDAPTLPRHLHRFALSLLRPAEAAARRLIIVAARGLVVEHPPLRQRKPKPKSILERNGVGTGIVRKGSIPDRASSRRVSLPLFDPLKRFGARRRYVKPSAAPRIRSFDDTRVPFFQPPRQPAPPPPAPDDPVDASRLARRLEAVAVALDDLPRQAKRLARWQARRHAQSKDGTAAGAASVNSGATGTQRPARLLRFSPMRPGRPPGWRRRPDHQVYEVLNELQGLAFWALEQPDTS
jgi:hypothetical protein